MSVLLTGGTGYIGSHTAVVLAEAGHEVILYDNFCNSHIGVLDSLAAILGRRLRFVEGDVLDTALLTRVLSDHRIDAVIHFAGLKAANQSISAPIDYYMNNVQGTISLLRAMEANSISKLVFSSSATVYGTPDYLPIDEDHPTRANTPYGRSKLHIEEILADVTRSNERWSVACLRYFNPVGAHESGLIGEDPLGIPTNLMPYIAQVAVGKLPHINIYGSDYDTPDGTGVRDFIHVLDLAEGHLAALHFLRGETGFHAFNLGTGRGQSVLEMMKAFEATCGKRLNHRFEARRTGDVAACYANPAKAMMRLGWKASRNVQDMCASTWRWQNTLQDQLPTDLAVGR